MSKSDYIAAPIYLVRWYEESDHDQKPHEQQMRVFEFVKDAEAFAFEVDPTATVWKSDGKNEVFLF